MGEVRAVKFKIFKIFLIITITHFFVAVNKTIDKRLGWTMVCIRVFLTLQVAS